MKSVSILTTYNYNRIRTIRPTLVSISQRLMIVVFDRLLEWHHQIVFELSDLTIGTIPVIDSVDPENLQPGLISLDLDVLAANDADK